MLPMTADPTSLQADIPGPEAAPLRPSDPPRDAPAYRLLVALPALDEARTIGEVIRKIPRQMPHVRSLDVLVVDDGSSDETARIAGEAGARVIHHPRSQGVGAAFHTALAYSLDHGFDLLVTIDSDGQFDPTDIPAFIAPVAAGEAAFATASRFKDPALVPEMPWVKKWGNRMLSRLISRLARQKFYDVSCGMRCYSRRAALCLHLIGRFTYTQEVFLNLAFKKLRLAEVPIRVRGEREFGDSRVAGNLWRYALLTSQIILRSYRDYHPLRFFGAVALVLMTAGGAIGAFFLLHYLRTGAFSPHIWAGFTSATFFFLALLALQTGMIGDILNRHRIYLEEVLYNQRRERQERPPERQPHRGHHL